MKVITLSAEEKRQSGYSHVIEIINTDLNAAATAQTIDLVTGLTAGAIVTAAAMRLVTPFSGGAGSGLLLEVGWDLTAGTDDPDGFINDYEINLAGTEILAADGNGAAFATLRTGFAFQETGKITATFTATGANLSTLTAGKVAIFLSIFDLDDLL